MNLLFTKANVRNVICLSSLVVSFELKKDDYHSLDHEGKERAESSSLGAPAEDEKSAAVGAFSERKGICHYTFTERVKICCCCTTDVLLRVSQSWDMDKGELLYESFADSGMHVRKRRVVTPGSSKNTCTVAEWIEGKCPPCLAGLVEGIAKDAHTAHMDKYHMLLNLLPSSSAASTDGAAAAAAQNTSN